MEQEQESLVTPQSELEEAKEAVKAALSGEADEAKEAPKEDKKAPEALEETPSENEIRKRLKERNKVIKERQGAKEEAERIKAEALALQQHIYAQKKAMEAELARIERLKQNPVEAIKEMGWDPEDLIHNLAKSGSYEGKVEAQLAAQKRAHEELAKKHEEFLRAQEEGKQRELLKQQEAFRGTIEQQFLTHALDEDKHPYTSSFYGDRKAALVAEGDWIADQYREVTGREASLEDIADYIEEQLEGYYNKIQEKQKSAASSKKGKPPLSESKGKKPPKVLNPENSEKASFADEKELADADDDDLLVKAKQAVRLAMRSEE